MNAGKSADWLERLFRESGLSKSGLAARLNLPQSAISRLLVGQRQFKVAELAPTAAYFGISRQRLNELMGHDEPAILPIQVEKGAIDLPIHRVTAAETGHFKLLEPTQVLNRPIELNPVKDAYGFFVGIDQMSPAFERGDIAVIDPSKPVAPGDDVVFIHTDGQRRLLRRLLSTSPASWRVEQFNPRNQTTLPYRDWPVAHRVFGIRKRG